MPTISAFYGIVIQMFWREHNPPIFTPFMGNMKQSSIFVSCVCCGDRCPVVLWGLSLNGRVSIETN